MEEKSMMMLIGAFLSIIVGISLIGVVASTGNEITNLINVSAENISYASARNVTGGQILGGHTYYIANIPSGWRVTECPITGFKLHNSSGVLTNLVDYNFTASTGAIMFNNSANVNGSASNTTTATYQLCPDNYLTQGWNRTVINLVPGFFALALMAIGVGLFYGVMKQEGLLSI